MKDTLLDPKALEVAASEYAKHHGSGKPHGYCLDAALRAYLSALTAEGDDENNPDRGLWRFWNSRARTYLADRDRLAAELAAYRSRPAAEVAVKPLEWVKHPVAEAWRADTMLGTYQVWIGSLATSWQFDGLLGERISEAADCEIAAKAAAQAHFNKAIRSALAAPAPVAEPAGEVVEKPRERWKIPARELSDEDLAADLEAAASKFANRGEHGGSPGEFWYERMDEIETEQARRAALRDQEA